jgi:hypothetical protein
MNRLGKMLLVATSLTPILAVCGLNSLMHNRWEAAAWFFGIFVVFTLLFVYVLFVVRRMLPTQDMVTDKVKPADKEVLAFLLSYLLPFFARDSTEFTGEVLSAVIVVVVIGLIVFHSSAYTFNPLLAIIGFHFYEVESGGMTYLLITRHHLAKPQNKLVVRHLCDYIFIDENHA